MNNIYDIWFARVEVANSIKQKIYSKFSTEEIYKLGKDEFLCFGLKEISVNKFLENRYKNNLEEYKEYMDKNNIYQIFYDDKRYPEKLKNIQNFPTYIFVKRKFRFDV